MHELSNDVLKPRVERQSVRQSAGRRENLSTLTFGLDSGPSKQKGTD